MRLGFMGTMLKQNDSNHYEKSWFVAPQNSITSVLKCENVSLFLMSQHCYYEFNLVGQTVNQAHDLKLWGMWGMQYEENGQKCELQQCGISITTMHHHSHTMLSQVLRRAFIWLILSRLSPIHQNTNYPERKISNSRGCHHKSDRWTESGSTDIIWTLLAKVEKVIGAMHCCWRKLFWRG
jgi:hypothetical protein